MVIDASVVFKWIAQEEGSDRALALLGQPLTAPVLLLSEIGNALRKKAMRDEIDPDVDFGDDLNRLDRLIDLKDERAAIGRALTMARVLRHPIYDCVYLALAERVGEVLVTADHKFIEKVEATQWSTIVRAL